MTIWRMRIACCVTKATDTHSEYVILLSHYNGYTNSPQCYVIRTLPVLSQQRRSEFTARLELNLSIKRITFWEGSGGGFVSCLPECWLEVSTEVLKSP